MTKPIHLVRKPRDWKNLHPAPRVAVEERNCCECVFYSIRTDMQDSFYTGQCNMTGKQMNSYDECGAFSRKSNKPEKE